MLEQRALLLERPPQDLAVEWPDTAPQHEQMAALHAGSRIELQPNEVPRGVEDSVASRRPPRRVEQLSRHGEPASNLDREHAHAATLDRRRPALLLGCGSCPRDCGPSHVLCWLRSVRARNRRKRRRPTWTRPARTCPGTVPGHVRFRRVRGVTNVCQFLHSYPLETCRRPIWQGPNGVGRRPSRPWLRLRDEDVSATAEGCLTVRRSDERARPHEPWLRLRDKAMSRIDAMGCFFVTVVRARPRCTGGATAAWPALPA